MPAESSSVTPPAPLSLLVSSPMSVLARVALAALMCCSVPAGVASAQASLPRSATGQFLSDWIAAYNAGDSASLERLKLQAPGVSLPKMATAKEGGGLALERVLASDARHLEAVLYGGDPASQRLMVLTTSSSDASRIARFVLVTIPAGRPLDELLISPEQKQRVIHGAVRALREHYVIPELGSKVADSLQAREKRSVYRSIASGRYLAEMLTAELRDVSGDRHLRVDFSVPTLPADFNAPPTIAQEQANMRQLRRANCTFLRAERTDGNIGVLKFNGFGAPKYCASTAAAAVEFLSGTDALIIDLRDNNGGDPDMVTLLCSFFFQQRTRLTTMFTRESGKAEDIWSDETLPGGIADSVPVYILTSRRTFSAGEAFAYQLQMLKRATIVGEVTGGGARPSRPRRIDDHFFINIPYAQMINPVSGTDWEGVGVQPDVRVPEGDALDTARRLATARLAERR